MKKFLAMLLALMMVLSLCACGSKPAAEAPAAEAPAADAPAAEADPADDFYLAIKFSNVFQPTEWNYKASEKLAQMITEKTEGHISVTYYGQNELDCYGDSVTRAVNGENWMGLEEPSLFADYAGDAAMVIAPMLYSSNAEYNYVMDSDFVANLIDELAAQGIHVLDTHYSFGFRSVVTNLNVTKPRPPLCLPRRWGAWALLPAPWASPSVCLPSPPVLLRALKAPSPPWPAPVTPTSW